MKNTTIPCQCCRQSLNLKVCESNGGFYLGHFCDHCGPHDRLSDYFGTRIEAETVLSLVLGSEPKCNHPALRD